MKTRTLKNTARAHLMRVATLGLMGLALLLAAGCGDGASSPEITPALVHPVATTSTPRPVAQLQSESAVHARVMAEHRLRMAAAPSTSTTSTGEHDAASAAADANPTVAADITAVVLEGGQTPLSGVWSGTAEQLAAFLLAECPTPRFTVPASVLAGYYVRYSAEAGLRADVLWAQMIHETGYGEYGGDVSPEQNNFAGIGATGGGAPGFHFLTAEAGVMAHVTHMVAYVYVSSPAPWANGSIDPRFDFVSPRGAARVLADLNGRWAVPGTFYGENIEGVVRAINSL